MRVELEREEARELLVVVVERLLEEAALPDSDRALLRKWRSDATPGSETARDLTDKINADLARVLETKKRSALVKADWR